MLVAVLFCILTINSIQQFEVDLRVIINITSLKNGGILDNHELSKINDILKEEVIHNEIVMNKNDWKDISDIIDDALDEVKEYEFDLSESSSNNQNPFT